MKFFKFSSNGLFWGVGSLGSFINDVQCLGEIKLWTIFIDLRTLEVLLT